MMSEPVQITHFSDLLCVWAYISDRRLVEVREQFGDSVTIDYRLITLFGDTSSKFGDGWKDRGGFEGYAAHVADVIAQFDHVELHPDAWTKTRPASVSGAHLLLKAVQLSSLEGQTGNFERLAWRMRVAFFGEARDIALHQVQMELAEELGLDRGPIEQHLFNGTAHAALEHDAHESELHGIEGSPTYLLNNGRQKLYGNVGFRIIEANIDELLRAPLSGQASWC